VKQRWNSIYLKGGGNAPIMLDCALWAGGPIAADTPPPTEKDAATNANTGGSDMRSFCMPRHGGFINCLFMDWSIRKVGVKELWTLEWHPDFNVHNTWTRAGGVTAERWPQWMRRFKDY